ncbi:methyl-accepting chemotaxis protein [Sediminispirochaeta bajacaliforniensis]|uniref:methyl-accepting chemotaxis protein n=1 Tax=Sediminispirochaeta bajacaliforniensis TaxID=148 RepID=UPI00036F54F8|nr:methyl-accepting chemotaxis protein [Sediminispirochaeta bajacaliforniensis]
MYLKRANLGTAIGSAVSVALMGAGMVLHEVADIDSIVLSIVTFVAVGGSVATTALWATGGAKDLNHWYEQVLDFVYLPMSITDMDMKWTFINEPVKNIIGVTREEVLGEHCSRWNADICNTEKCGVMMLRRGLSRSYFTNEGVNRNFQVDTTYLYDRRNKEKRIGHLELVSDVTTKVRLGTAVDQLKLSSQTLASTIEQEASTTTEISATAEEFAQNIKSISSNTERQFRTIEETVSGLEEMAASVQSVATNAAKASSASRESVETAEAGRAEIGESVRGIKEISDSLIAISDEISRLSDKAAAVDEILQVINSIAAQTNLLSMNAAIEAAHAGDAGRGFSVVATEIRKLAENSQTSSKEIEQIIEEIKLDISKALNLSISGREIATKNASVVETSLEALGRIVNGVELINDMLAGIETTTKEQSSANSDILNDAKNLMAISNEIRDAVNEQSQGIQQISAALQTLADGTSHTVESAEGLMTTANALALADE